MLFLQTSYFLNNNLIDPSTVRKVNGGGVAVFSTFVRFRLYFGVVLFSDLGLKRLLATGRGYFKKGNY